MLFSCFQEKPGKRSETYILLERFQAADIYGKLPLLKLQHSVR